MFDAACRNGERVTEPARRRSRRDSSCRECTVSRSSYRCTKNRRGTVCRRWSRWGKTACGPAATPRDVMTFTTAAEAAAATTTTTTATTTSATTMPLTGAYQRARRDVARVMVRARHRLHNSRSGAVQLLWTLQRVRSLRLGSAKRAPISGDAGYQVPGVCSGDLHVSRWCRDGRDVRHSAQL